ncbi:MAG TPA: membrane protein insertion efficiency factor YidD [Thermoanaerobaculia bacterium]|nr:membrane protein insertion efficiency factor YidD [Thermoanaerobaculia bacterium]
MTRSTGEMPWAGRSPSSRWPHGTRSAAETRWTRWPVVLLAAYKRWLSPLLPRSCRFSPTCSEYARVALLKYGFWRGGARGAARLLRCQPFHPGGIDLP